MFHNFYREIKFNNYKMGKLLNRTVSVFLTGLLLIGMVTLIMNVKRLGIGFAETPEHDIVVSNVVPSTPGVNLSAPIPKKTILGRGYSTTIYVAVENQGRNTETDLQIDIYWSNSTHFNQTIYSFVISELAASTFIILNTAWNTGGLMYGNYTISGYAVPVLGEENITNNLFIGSDVKVGVPCDIYWLDGYCNMRDIGYITSHFMTTPTEPQETGWDPNADINNDGVVNMRDIGIAANNFYKSEWD